jgi:hypothetical protein
MAPEKNILIIAIIIIIIIIIVILSRVTPLI